MPGTDSTAPVEGERSADGLVITYVLHQFPQRSQTFVRDEIWALRAIDADVDVVVLEPAEDDAPNVEWAGPHRQIARPTPVRAVRDHLWWFRRQPRRYLSFLTVVLRLRERWRYALLRLPSEARRLAASPPTRLHTHFAWSTASSVAALAALLGLPPSITVHAKDIYAQTPRKVRRRLDAFELIVTVCHFNVGHLAGAGITGFADPRVHVVPCAVAFPELAPITDPVDVVAVGRLVEKKGFDILLDALSRVRSEHPQVSVVLVGAGSERATLEARCESLGVSNNVKFTGSLPHAETLELIGRGRLFCLPARPTSDGDSDAMPVVIREAMARGVPVVVSRLAGIPESVDDSVGWLVTPGSVPELERALLDALGDESRRAQRGQAARQRADALWRPARRAAELADLFDARRIGAGI